MTEKGFIISRPSGETTLNGPEYLLDDKDEIRHFNTKQEVTDFLEEHGIDEEDVSIQYHAFCMQCGKEFFFDTDEMPEEEDLVFYFCPDCAKIINEKQQMN
jgi:DNA-directed RNA polymerase subunit RPC12/RpoP